MGQYPNTTDIEGNRYDLDKMVNIGELEQHIAPMPGDHILVDTEHPSAVDPMAKIHEAPSEDIPVAKVKSYLPYGIAFLAVIGIYFLMRK